MFSHACILFLTFAANGAKVQIERDIQYYPESALHGSSADGRRERCRLDFRYPSDITNFPTVVWFHGGGLAGGERHFIDIDASRIAQAAVNYRLLKEDRSVTGDDCIDDAAAAVAWTLNNVHRYGGDVKKVYVAGMSAGGYLTMMVGMDPSRLARWGFKPTDLAGILPVSGQATEHFNVRRFAGDKDPQYLPKVNRLAPLAFCSANLPPILSLCGQPPWEWKARNEENRLLIASCVALGHRSAQFVELPFCDHGRAERASYPYIQFFILGQMPADLVIPASRH